MLCQGSSSGHTHTHKLSYKTAHNKIYDKINIDTTRASMFIWSSAEIQYKDKLLYSDTYSAAITICLKVPSRAHKPSTRILDSGQNNATVVAVVRFASG